MYVRILRLFTGVVYVDHGSNLFLAGKIVFANNTTADGGTTAKCINKASLCSR